MKNPERADMLRTMIGGQVILLWQIFLFSITAENSTNLQSSEKSLRILMFSLLISLRF